MSITLTQEGRKCDHVQIHPRPRLAPRKPSRISHPQGLVDRLIAHYTWEGHPYNPDWYGYSILIQEGDVNRNLDEIWDGCSLLTILWEGIMLRNGFSIAFYLANNEYGLCFVIPDAPWVNGELHVLIEEILDPLPFELTLMRKPMSKSEDTKMKVLKTASCDTPSGKSRLTYQIGVTPESDIHLRISNNSGKGCYSNEWRLTFGAIHDALKKLHTPISSYYLAHLYKGKSVNTSSFLLATLKHLKLVRAFPNNRRHHELVDPQPILEQVEKLTSSGRQAKPKPVGNTGGSASTKKTATRKTGGNAAAAARKTSKTVGESVFHQATRKGQHIVQVQET